MKPKDLLIRCMAWQSGDLWIAASIDFGLAAQAHTAEEARQKLHGQIIEYVRDAFGADSKHADYLLSRRAPLIDRARYSFWDFLANRPSLRAVARKAVRSVGLAIKNKMAYQDSMPIIAA